MKRKNKRATKAQRDQRGQVPEPHKCPNCPFIALSKYALKAHRQEVCRG